MQSREEWMQEQVKLTCDYIDSISEISDKLAKLGPDIKSAIGASSLARIEDALPLHIAPNLSPTHHKAAVLIGRGLAFHETEAKLGLKTGEIFQIHQQEPEFRRAVEYYQTVDEEEIGGLARQTIKRMLVDDDIDPKVKVSLLSVAQKVGIQPHTRRMDVADKILRREQIEATREVSAQPARLIGVVEKPVDADFEVITGDED